MRRLSGERAGGGCVLPQACQFGAIPCPASPERRAGPPCRGGAREKELEALGTLPLRAPVGHGARGLLGGRRELAVLHPRARAVSRAYRWGEDGLLGITTGNAGCALRWRSGTGATRSSRSGSSGSPNAEGNHGEDVKECYFYLDATPTHSWMSALYKYPQARLPLRAPQGRVTAAATRDDPEFELSTRASSTEGRYFDVLAEYAKAGPDDICIRITAANRGPEAARAPPPADALVPQHVVLGMQARGLQPQAARLRAVSEHAASQCDHETLGRMILDVGPGVKAPRRFSSPKTRATRSSFSAAENSTPYVKDSIGRFRRRAAGSTR